MTAIERYGIVLGQVYVPADGSKGRLIVRDIHSYADVDDVVVYDELQGKERRIDAFKLSTVRYRLAEHSTFEERKALIGQLRAGEADHDQQARAAQLILALASQLDAQAADVRRGKYVVENAEWRTLNDEQDGLRTWLSVRVKDGANLDCKAFRALALDEVIARDNRT